MATRTKATAADLPRGTAPRFEHLPIDSIDVADNVRTVVDAELDAQLADSIRALGILQPITVTETGDGRYLVRYGHRRLRAAAAAGLTVVDALVEPDDAPGDRVVEQLVENLQRSDLNALEEARALRAILDADPDLTQAALAKRLGRSASWVANTLRLLEVAEPVQQLLAEGKLTASHVKVIAGVAPEHQAKVAEITVKQGSSSHDLERNVDWYVQRANQAETDALRRQTEQAETIQKAIASLAKRAEKTDPVVVGSYHGADAVQYLVVALTREGYDVKTKSGYLSSAPGTKYCDCRAWQVTPGMSNLVSRFCLNGKHADAEQKAKNQKSTDEFAAKGAALKAARTVAAESLAAHPLDRPFAELLLWRLLEWQRDDWARARKKGTDAKGKADPWSAICGLSDGELTTEIVNRLMGAEAPAALAEAAA